MEPPAAANTSQGVAFGSTCFGAKDLSGSGAESVRCVCRKPKEHAAEESPAVGDCPFEHMGESCVQGRSEAML